mmetsp:Transcript_12235/g.21512  ORF Transcript_12235/g.21512 Transcript_12235/m.21512 type:complete len:106 (+) Transcript_12235:131-448(+)
MLPFLPSYNFGGMAWLLTHATTFLKLAAKSSMNGSTDIEKRRQNCHPECNESYNTTDPFRYLSFMVKRFERLLEGIFEARTKQDFLYLIIQGTKKLHRKGIQDHV